MGKKCAMRHKIINLFYGFEIIKKKYKNVFNIWYDYNEVYGDKLIKVNENRKVYFFRPGLIF